MGLSWFTKIFNRKSPYELVDAVRRAFGISAGAHVSEDSAMRVAAYYRGVVYISTQIAKLPWDIKDKSYNIVEDGVSLLLNLSPNSEMNAFTFRLTMIQNAINHGNAFAEIERDIRGTPTALWPIPSKNVELVRDQDNRLLYRIIGGSASQAGSDVYLLPRDVFHVRNFHTKDGLVGQGVVAYGRDVLGISIGADRMAGNLFANGGLPSGVLEVPGTLSEEAFKRIKESWTESHSGRKSAGVAVLEEGMKFSATTLDPDVLQFLESRKFSVIEICRFLGVPPTKLFDTSAATFNNIENSNLEVATDTLDAWARNLEMEADVKILNNRRGGRFSELHLDSVFRGDMKSRSEYFKTMFNIGSLKPNEIRELEGRAPYAGGDRFYVATNNLAPADRIDELYDAQIEKNKTPPEAKKPTALEKAALNFLENT